VRFEYQFQNVCEYLILILSLFAFPQISVVESVLGFFMLVWYALVLLYSIHGIVSFSVGRYHGHMLSFHDTTTHVAHVFHMFSFYFSAFAILINYTDIGHISLRLRLVQNQKRATIRLHTLCPRLMIT
jgi:hypothetical protein